MTKNSSSRLFPQDRAAIVATAVVAIARDWMAEPELRTRIAAYLRQEFSDVAQQVISENRTDV
jgi:hypothetical protein